jgi:hypothetical protein
MVRIARNIKILTSGEPEKIMSRAKDKIRTFSLAKELVRAIAPVVELTVGYCRAGACFRNRDMTRKNQEKWRKTRFIPPLPAN